MRSACLPTSNDPTLPSCTRFQAQPTVLARSASSRDSRCSGGTPGTAGLNDFPLTTYQRSTNGGYGATFIASVDKQRWMPLSNMLLKRGVRPTPSAFTRASVASVGLTPSLPGWAIDQWRSAIGWTLLACSQKLSTAAWVASALAWFSKQI